MYLGINSYVHDASAALVDREGRVIAAVEEERFSRKKREARFPVESIRACLEIAGADFGDIESIGFPWHPGAFLWGRLIRTNLVGRVRPSVWRANTELLAKIMRLSHELEQSFPASKRKRVRYFKHHAAHAASAFFCSPFDEAACLTIDGRGELESITWSRCRGAHIDQIGHLDFPNSIGKLYSAVCRFLGFNRAEKDGTVMALAGCGEPTFLNEFRQILRIEPREGIRGIRLAAEYFDLQGTAMPSKRLSQLLNVEARRPDDPILDVHKAIAASLQFVTQEAILHLIRELHSIAGSNNLVMAGGVSLNSVANGAILERTPFQRLFIQPAAHDGGLSLGAALLLAHENRSRKTPYSMETASLGPEYSDEDCRLALAHEERSSLHIAQPPDLEREVARRLAQGQVLGIFRGRMEFGPRALGNRSILADPRNPLIQQRLNEAKGREPFRPFAAAILLEHAKAWLLHGTESPFMLLVDNFRVEVSAQVPGVQHQDGSVRVQTVKYDTDPFYYGIIRSFADLTGVPLVLNTSLNVRGEPIACTPTDALRTFSAGGMDGLVLGNYLVTRDEASVGALSAEADSLNCEIPIACYSS